MVGGAVDHDLLVVDGHVNVGAASLLDGDADGGVVLKVQPGHDLKKKQFSSILYFISHTEQYNFALIIKLSLASINCTECHGVFILIIHDVVFGNVHVLWK